MKYWPKYLSRLLIVCYLAVSSIAGVHAFPSSPHVDGGSVESSLSVDAADAEIEMMADCHQQNQESSQFSVSTCKIFCAAMASAISTEFSLSLAQIFISPEITFTADKLQAYEFSLEPHPPK